MDGLLLELLTNDIIVLYFVICVGIISFEIFRTKQKVMIVYLITYLACCYNRLGNALGIVLPVIFLFIYFEYICNDKDKEKLIRKFLYKILDAVYLLVVQYGFIYYLLSLILQSEYISTFYNDSIWYSLSKLLSIVFLIICVHSVSINTFEILPYSEFLKVFEMNPIYEFPFQIIEHKKFELLVDIEDKSYLNRKNSYSLISKEFFRYKYSNFKENINGCTFDKKISYIRYSIKNYYEKTQHWRGYSTIEMQLIRNIGIDGYTQTLKRKLYENIYAPILLKSLKSYLSGRYSINLEHYKEYLIWIYFKSVKCRIKNIDIIPVCSAFKSEHMEDWSMEGLFIACMGLSHKGKEWYQEEPYNKIIKKYGLDMLKINEMYDKYSNDNKLS